MSDQRDIELNALPIEANDPIEMIEHAEPVEPIDMNEPTDPMESTEPFEPIERNELSDQRDHRDVPSLVAMRPVSRRDPGPFSTRRRAAPGLLRGPLTHEERRAFSARSTVNPAMRAGAASAR
jgi:hypothetical protein